MKTTMAAQDFTAWSAAWELLAQTAERHPRLTLRAMRGLIKARKPGHPVNWPAGQSCRPQVVLLCAVQPLLVAARVLEQPQVSRAKYRSLDAAMDEIAPAFAAAARALRLRRESVS